MSTNAVIELDRLVVRIGQRVILKDLTGTLTGRAIGLLGPNGAGKSTLLNTLLGFHKPFSGTARIFGHDIRTHARRVRSLIGYMPENDSFIANMSGIRFVRMMAELSGLPPAEALERAHEAFFYTGLGEVRYRNIGTYSLGMKQMAKLAQAIVHGPKLLFLDEPTNGLDPPARRRMLDLIREIRDRGDLHIIISSHLLRDVEECCDQVLILKDGRIADTCDLEEERRANRKFLEMETKGGSEEFVLDIERLGCQAAWSGNGRVKLVMPDGLDVRQIFRIAADRAVQIRRLNFRRDSLEDIFLRAMEDQPPAAAPAPAPQKEAVHGRL
ncbi:MAG: ABC transporter ATP-binding protein [Bryobacteraceae bacterium]|nr:ABC transporter ATP-binding protein [Bryobacteraceae bacterium]